MKKNFDKKNQVNNENNKNSAQDKTFVGNDKKSGKKVGSMFTLLNNFKDIVKFLISPRDISNTIYNVSIKIIGYFLSILFIFIIIWYITKDIAQIITPRLKEVIKISILSDKESIIKTQLKEFRNEKYKIKTEFFNEVEEFVKASEKSDISIIMGEENQKLLNKYNIFSPLNKKNVLKYTNSQIAINVVTHNWVSLCKYNDELYHDKIQKDIETKENFQIIEQSKNSIIIGINMPSNDDKLAVLVSFLSQKC